VGDFNVATSDLDVYNPTGLREHVDFHPAAQAALEQVRQWGLRMCSAAIIPMSRGSSVIGTTAPAIR
jgi:exonuclease III